MAESKSPLRDSAILLAGATALLYCISTAHTGGYLSLLLLDADVLDRNFHQVLYNGFLVAFGPALVVLVMYGLTSTFYSFALLPWLTDWLRKSAANKRRFFKAKRRLLGKRRLSSVERTAQGHTLRALRYCGLAITLIASLVYFEAQGSKQASALLELAEGRRPIPASSLVHVTLNGTERTLLHLFCGARNCAGMDPRSSTVFYYPQQGHSYRYEKRGTPRSSPTAAASSPVTDRTP